MTDQLQSIRERWEAATKPLVRNGTLMLPTHTEIDLSGPTDADWITIKTEHPEADADFHASAPDDIAYLLRCVEAGEALAKAGDKAGLWLALGSPESQALARPLNVAWSKWRQAREG